MSRGSSVLSLGVLALFSCKDGDGGNDDSSGVIDDSGTGGDDSSTDDSGTLPDTVSARIQFVVGGLVAPTELQTLPWDPDHLYVLDQPGQVYRIDPGAAKVALGEPWADVSGTIEALDKKYDERGLLGMAASDAGDMAGLVYFFHTYPASSWPSLPKGYDHENVVAEFQTLKDGSLDAKSGRTIWNDDHPYMNHNGGSLAFGDDGLLYISLGDGGNKNDVGTGHPEMGNGQDRTTQEGSILRISVGSKEKTYGIPSDNPFVGKSGAPEIYAYGFRNPSGIAFDRTTGDLFAADAGQSMMEEVDVVESGKNYGWNTKEGTLCFNDKDELAPLDTCADTDSYGVALTDPILTYVNGDSPQASDATGPVGSVIVGGAVYRGGSIAGFEDGDYIFGSFTTGGDSTTGQLLLGRRDGTGWKLMPIGLGADLGYYVRHVSADADGNIYVLTSSTLGPDGTTGQVFRLVSAPKTE